MAAAAIEITTGFECPNCKGEGHTPEMVNWSDGWGMTQRRCGLCDGSGRIAADPVVLAMQYKAQAEALAVQHRTFVVHTALYLKTSRGVQMDPPLADAKGPSCRASTWLPYLCKEIKALPRVQPGDCGHADPSICRANIEKHPTSTAAAICRVTLGLPQLTVAEIDESIRSSGSRW